MTVAAQQGSGNGAGPRPDAGPRGASPAPREPEQLTRAEVRLRRLLVVLAVVFFASGLLYLAQALPTPLQESWAHAPFIVNAVTKDAVLTLLAVMAAADLRRYGALVGVLVVAHVFLVAGLALWLLLGAHDPPGTLFLAGWLAAATLVLIVLTLARRAALRARYGLRWLRHHEFATLSALAEVLVMGDDEQLHHHDVVRNVDAYLHEIRGARGVGRLRLAFLGLTLLPLAGLRAPFPLLAPASRARFVKKHLIGEAARRTVSLRAARQGMVRLAQQMVFMGYYSDPATFAAVGYTRFPDRGGTPAAAPAPAAEATAASPLPAAEGHGPRPAAEADAGANGGVRALDTRSPREVRDTALTCDVAVVGSGAGGAIAAHRLAHAGKRVLVLEGGRHVRPSEMTDHEPTAYARLYADGALQLSSDFRFSVLQGRCVGGSTTVNNAVCFDPPEAVLGDWSAAAPGFDPAALGESVAAVRSLLEVERLPERNMNPGAPAFVRGIEALGLDGELDVVEANIRDCVGCGLCNLGCAHGRKLSMLDHVLPSAQSPDVEHPVEILSGCRVERVEHRQGRATGLRCRLSDGRTLRVEARESVVVAAGAMASSWLLRRSRAGGRAVGRGLSFNLATPLHAEFPDRLKSYGGLQMSHFFRPANGAGYMLETWFNPPMTESLVMPGWFEEHYANMRAYDRMAAAGVLVGSRPTGEIGRRLRIAGDEVIRYRPDEGELAAVKAGLVALGTAFLRAGATRVMPSTFAYREYRTEAELAQLDEHVRDNADLSLGSAHPQGGNAMGADPRRSVVDHRLRVHGFGNLFVADASVFPSAVGVNPQLTVMAMAHHAAGEALAAAA